MGFAVRSIFDMKKKLTTNRDLKDSINVELRHAGDADAAIARTLTHPAVQAARSIQAFQGGGIPLTSLIDELTEQVDACKQGDLARPEAMLLAQAHTLDEIFNNLALRANLNILNGYGDAGERYLRLALKAQGQCRSTLETLAIIKNPPVVFAKQANFAAGHQQINNAVRIRFGTASENTRSEDAATGVPARAEENQTQQTELLEKTHGKWLDTGKEGSTGSCDTAVATVGSVHRT